MKLFWSCITAIIGNAASQGVNTTKASVIDVSFTKVDQFTKIIKVRCDEVCVNDPEYSTTGYCPTHCKAQDGDVKGGYCCLNDENSAENYCSSDRLKKYAFPDDKLHYCTTAINKKDTNDAGCDDLVCATCDSKGFHIKINEAKRKAAYDFIMWPSTFVDGRKNAYEMPRPRPPKECLADGSGSQWEFHTAFGQCNIAEPVIITDPSTGIEYFIYTLYLNYDDGISGSIGSAFGNLQQLEQNMIECQISRKWQEDATAGNIDIKKAGIIKDIRYKLDLFEQLQLDVYKGGFSNPAVWSPTALEPTDTVKIGEHIKLRISNTDPLKPVLSDWNVAIEDCWASTVENRATGQVDTGVIHFDQPGTNGVPGAVPPVTHETVKFWDRQCPVFNWIYPLIQTEQAENTEITLRQFAFNDNRGTFANNFYYHCIVVLCEIDKDCATGCKNPPDGPGAPKPSDNAPSGRRRRAVVSSKVVDFVTTIDFGRNEVDKSGEIKPSINFRINNTCEYGIKQDGNAFICKESSSASLARSLFATFLIYVLL